MASIFTRIVKGEIPCHKVAESEAYLAFLDIRPLSKGHTLVIPKEEIDYFFDLDDSTLAGLMSFAKQVAKSIEKVTLYNSIGQSSNVWTENLQPDEIRLPAQNLSTGVYIINIQT